MEAPTPPQPGAGKGGSGKVLSEPSVMSGLGAGQDGGGNAKDKIKGIQDGGVNVSKGMEVPGVQ